MLTARVPARLSVQEVCMWGSGPIRTQREEKEEAALAAKLCSVWGFLGFDLGFFFGGGGLTSTDQHQKKCDFFTFT